MGRLTLLVVAVLALGGAQGARGQDAAQAKQLQAQVELLQAKLEAANLKIEKLLQEIQQLKAGGKDGALEGGRRSLSERLIVGGVFKGDWVSTNPGAENRRGKGTLTVTERKSNNIKAKWLATSEGKPDSEFDVTGTITGNGLTTKSIDAPNPFTLVGRLLDDVLTLQFSGPHTKATVKLKVE